MKLLSSGMSTSFLLSEQFDPVIAYLQLLTTIILDTH